MMLEMGLIGFQISRVLKIVFKTSKPKTSKPRRGEILLSSLGLCYSSGELP